MPRRMLAAMRRKVGRSILPVGFQAVDGAGPVETLGAVEAAEAL